MSGSVRELFEWVIWSLVFAAALSGRPWVFPEGAANAILQSGSGSASVGQEVPHQGRTVLGSRDQRASIRGEL
jgi:hypothetical protein